MIEVSKTSYTVIAVTSSGTQLDITDAVEGLGWEDNEDELAVKISFTAYNIKYNGKLLSNLVQIGCMVAIKAKWSSGKDIVASGYIVEEERLTANTDATFSVVAYDVLYNLQKSQDNIYFAAGKSTQSALSSIFSSWGLSISKYSGPNVTHSKILYKNQYLGDIVRDILKEAKKKGGCQAIIRAVQNKVEIVQVGTNDPIYRFEKDNSVQAKHKVSIADLVTRVKIVGSEKDDGLPEVEAIVDGKTEYGIFQRIQNSASADSISDAKATAQETLDEKGSPAETCTLVAPDVPSIRKGDMVSLKAGALKGDFIVLSIQHNADSGKMTMQVEKYAA